MRYFKILLSFCLAGSLALAKERGKEVSDLIVRTATGKVRGNKLTSLSGRDFNAFRGIRFAQPPVGPLRFKDPLPVEPWDGIFDATKDGPMCPQLWNNSADLDEDCLRLNIFTHDLPSESDSKDLKPVIVWLHPGGFYSMSGHSELFAGPAYFMDRDIVLVTMNYRLGSLGFLATGTREAPGNAGLKDQVIALRWIQKNIARFGGDPNSVTLLGYSAGSISIGLHMISPMSKNLFHKGVLMSGSPIPKYSVPSEQLFLAERQARLLNCTVGNISEMIDCLRMKPFMEFPNTFTNMFWIGGLPVLLFKPVIEPDFGQERFLTEDPVKAYQEGRFMRIPVIAGRNKDEFVNIALDILRSEEFRQNMDANWEEYAPIVFTYDEKTPLSRNISNSLRKEFLGDAPLSLNNSLEGMINLVNENGFTVHRYVHLAARFTKVYYYHFSYQGRWSYFNYPDEKPYGVSHHDDTLYLFTRPVIAPTFTADFPEHVTMQRLTRMWTTFAYSGDPNNQNDEYLKDLRWTPFSCDRENYLEIGENLEMRHNLETDLVAIWERIFPLDWTTQDHPHYKGEHLQICPNYPPVINKHKGDVQHNDDH